MLQAITVSIEAAKAEILVDEGTENPVNAARSVQVMFKIGSQAPKQPIFNLKTMGKYQELLNFEIKNILLTNSYNIQDNEKVPVILNLLCREGLQFTETLNDGEQEKYKTSMGLFKVLSKEFNPQHNDTILSLQYCKPIRGQNESAE